MNDYAMVILGVITMFVIWLLFAKQEYFAEITAQITNDNDISNEKTKLCKIEEHETVVHDYIRQNLLKNATQECYPLGDKCLDDYRNDFYNFRNMINQNSTNTGEDAVDKINDLYLTNNSDVARGFNGKTIGSLFDYLTTQ